MIINMQNEVLYTFPSNIHSSKLFSENMLAVEIDGKFTYLTSSFEVLNASFQVRNYNKLFFAGQISGVEGYVESAASGLNVYDTEDLIDEYLDPSHQENIVKESEKRTSIFKITDIRFFYNSLERAISILKQTGITVNEKKTENEDNIDIYINIKKYN